MQVHELIKKLRELGEIDSLVLVEMDGKRELIEKVSFTHNNPLVTNVIIKAKNSETKSGKEYGKSKAVRKYKRKIR